MALRALQLGDPTTIKQNEVYALPAVLVQIATTVACQVSIDGVAWNAFTSESTTAAAFIRCTTADSIVICKKAAASGPASLLALGMNITPPAPLAGKVQIYLDKNLAGKYRIRAMFPSGLSANILVEP